jgi:hypothetical protein
MDVCVSRQLPTCKFLACYIPLDYQPNPSIFQYGMTRGHTGTIMSKVLGRGWLTGRGRARTHGAGQVTPLRPNERGARDAAPAGVVWSLAVSLGEQPEVSLITDS